MTYPTVSGAISTTLGTQPSTMGRRRSIMRLSPPTMGSTIPIGSVGGLVLPTILGAHPVIMGERWPIVGPRPPTPRSTSPIGSAGDLGLSRGAIPGVKGVLACPRGYIGCFFFLPGSFTPFLPSRCPCLAHVPTRGLRLSTGATPRVGGVGRGSAMCPPFPSGAHIPSFPPRSLGPGTCTSIRC